MSRATAKKVNKLIAKLEKIRTEIDTMQTAEREALSGEPSDEKIEYAIDQLEQANHELGSAMCSLTEALQLD